MRRHGGHTAQSELDDLVVICGTTFWAGTQLLDQHIAQNMTAYAPVLYVDPPVSIVSRFRNPEVSDAALPAGLHTVSARLSVVAPRVPPLKERPVGKQVALHLTRRAMRAAVRHMGAPSVRAVIVPSLNPLFHALDERLSVFYAKDDYVAGAALMGISRRRLERRAAKQPCDADLVVAVSPTLVSRLRGPGVEPLLIPNGCDVEAFASAGPPPQGEPPAVAFVGHLSNRVDVDLLDAVAATGVKLLILGAPQQTMCEGLFDRVLDRPNVSWKGAVPYASLPDELSRVTTCLLPYANTEFNRASFPLKILEYLAAGRRVVSTPLPAVQWLDTDYVQTAEAPRDFALMVTQTLQQPLEEHEIAARRRFAAKHSWESRTRLLAEALGLVTPSGTSGVGINGQGAASARGGAS